MNMNARTHCGHCHECGEGLTTVADNEERGMRDEN